MQILQESERITQREFSLGFASFETPGWGYGFPCDADGNLLSLNPAAANNYDYAIAHPELFEATGVREHVWSYTQPAIGKCSCGHRVELDAFTNTCDCGRDYNMSGQLLAPRRFWGEETSETPSECI